MADWSGVQQGLVSGFQIGQKTGGRLSGLGAALSTIAERLKAQQDSQSALNLLGQTEAIKSQYAKYEPKTKEEALAFEKAKSGITTSPKEQVENITNQEILNEANKTGRNVSDIVNERKISEKSKVPTVQQRNDLTNVNSQIENIRAVKELADKIPAGRFAGSISGLKSSISGGELDTDTRQYLKQRPAYAVSLYRALTGDTRLSDADAKSRALPLLWHPTESNKIRESSFDYINKALEARKRLIEKGQYKVDGEQYITPLEDVLAETESGSGISQGGGFPMPSAKEASIKKAQGYTGYDIETGKWVK